MKIKKVDDKPMVIHTKEKAKIHAHEPKGAKIKGSNIYTVERGPKTIGAKVSDDKKKSYRKSTIHQSESKNKRLSRFERNYRESNTSIKTRGTETNMLMTLDDYKSFIAIDDMSELADNLLQLGRTLGKADNFTEYYRAPNVTVFARICKDDVQLGHFLQGLYNDSKQIRFDKELSSPECLTKMKELAMTDKGWIDDFSLHYEMENRSFERGQTFHNFNDHDYMVLEALSPRNLVVMDMKSGSLTIALGATEYKRYPKDEKHCGCCIVLQQIDDILRDTGTKSSLLSYFLPELLQIFCRILGIKQDVKLINIEPCCLASLAILNNPVLNRLHHDKHCDRTKLRT